MEELELVYCTKCGTKNEDDTEYCSNCKAALKTEVSRRRKSQGECFGSGRRGRHEDECLGLPHGGAIAGIIFGVIIVIIGLAILMGFSIWSYLWPLLILILGVLIIAGALYGMGRNY
jgi:uncharacterized membrane protein YvbJ